MRRIIALWWLFTTVYNRPEQEDEFTFGRKLLTKIQGQFPEKIREDCQLRKIDDVITVVPDDLIRMKARYKCSQHDQEKICYLQINVKPDDEFRLSQLYCSVTDVSEIL